MEKEYINAEKATQNLIAYYILWGFLFGIIYNLVYTFITANMESLILQVIVTIVLQGIVAFLLWKFSMSSVFKKKTILYYDVPKVMKNLTIFTIIICIISGIYNISRVNSSIKETIQSDYKLKYYENLMSKYYTDSQKEKYQLEKEKIIKEAKNKAYQYLIIIEIGLTATCIGVLPLGKRELLKYVT